MPYSAPTVNYSATVDGTYTTLTGVQSVNISRGRERFQDPINQTQLIVTLIPANSYALPLAVGQAIDVRSSNSGSASCYFQGYITDVERTYEMPYNSGTGAAPSDRITIIATGATGIIGSVVASTIPVAATTSAGIEQVFAYTGIYRYYNSFTRDIDTKIQASSGSYLEALNTYLNSAQYTFDEIAHSRTISQLAAMVYNTGTTFRNITFRDDGGVGFKFSALNFLSSVQNRFNDVTVISPSIYTANVQGTAPFNSLTYNVWNLYASDVTSLANYIYNTYSNLSSPAPYSISTNTAVDSSCMSLALMPTSAAGYSEAVIGQQVTTIFRGSTSYASVMGVNASFYPDYGSVQLHLSPSLGTPFILDSTAFGVLDTNRLGYP